MLTYEPLEIYLFQQPGETIAMSFADVERVIGHKLPPSAHKRNEWWSNNATNHSQAKAWLSAGFETANLDRKAKKVVFRRAARSGAGQGMQEETRMFKPAQTFTPPAKKVDRHPAIGALKGMFTIEPGYDIASSDPEIVAEWEDAIERKVALYEAGRTKK